GMVCSCLSATLACMVLAYMGTACSLAARSWPAALVPTFLAAAAWLVGILLIGLFFRRGHAPVLWLLTAALLAGSYWRVRKKLPAATVGCSFLAVHLALTGLAVCWTVANHDEEWPVVGMNPAYYTLALLNRRAGDQPLPYAALPFYWTALLVNLAWM